MTSCSPRVSVILPCRNEIAHIGSCISSILDQREPVGGFELLVVDGMSDDGTRDVLAGLQRKDPRVITFDNPCRIVSTGLNIGIQNSRGEIIVRMDAHSEYSPDYIRNCVDVLDETRADNVGGAAKTKNHTYVQKAICAAYECALVVGGARFHLPDYEGYVDTVPYGCWRKELFQRIGLFDEELVRNQDDELNLRTIRSGGKIWQSAMIKSWYYPRRSLIGLFEQYSQYGYWKVRVIQKHRIPASVRHLVPGLFLLMFVLFGIFSMFSKGALVIWLVLITAYAVVNLVASIKSASQSGADILPVLPFVVACYHFGYGYGFLRGLLDFVVFRRRSSIRFSALTRLI